MQDPAPLADGLEAAPVTDEVTPPDAATYVPTVVAPGYRGPERRRPGPVNALRRALHGRSLAARAVQIGAGAAVLAVAGVAGAAGLTGSATPAARPAAAVTAAARAGHVGTTRPAGHPGTTPTTAAHQAPPVTAPPVTAPPVTAPPVTAPPVTAPPATAPPVTAPPAAESPQQLGAEALTLVRYPWQRIPGYSIQFLPISDAPSSGFYGNTSFTWGQAGGTSTLYVFPGETVQQLAGIIAFEIGHEVDAAAVDPQGGHTQIENILGIHPASWAPNCDCAEQNFLSGWYAAAFSAYWSPGVGQWSNVAPMPTGATLAAVEPWLNPTIG